MGIRIVSLLNRRRLLKTLSSAVLVAGADGVARPYLSRASDRPSVTHGLQSGDVTTDSGMVWARADRPARMQVEVSTVESFKTIHSGVYVDVLPEADFTAKALIENLPAGQDIFYRIRFQDLTSPTILGEPMIGRFRTRRPTAAQCRSSGPVTPRGRVGASTKRAAACVPTRRCRRTARTSSSTAATRSMPTGRFRPN